MEEKRRSKSQPQQGLPKLNRRRPERDGGAGRGREWDRPFGSSLAAEASLGAVPRQPPPHHQSFFPQVMRRQTQVAPWGSQSQALPLRGERLPRLPCPESCQDTRSTGTRTGRQGEMAAKLLPSRAAAARQVGGPGRRLGQGMQSGKLPLGPPLLPRSPGQGLSVPRSGLGQEETVRLPSIPLAAPRHSQAASVPCQLPPLPPAAWAAAAGRRTASMATASSSHLPPVPIARGSRAEQGTAPRLQSLRAAPRRPQGQDAAGKPRSRVPGPDMSPKGCPGSQTPRQQAAAQGERALSRPGSPGLGREAGSGRERPMSQQGPALQGVPMKRNLPSTALPLRDESGKDVSVVPKSEGPAQLKVRSQGGHCTAQDAGEKAGSRLPEPTISRKSYPGRQRPRQQPAAQRGRALSLPVSASLGSQAGPQQQRQAAEQEPAVQGVRKKHSVSSTALPGQERPRKRGSVLAQSERSQKLKTWRLVCHCMAQDAAVKPRGLVTVRVVSPEISPGSRRPSQQPDPQCCRARSLPVAASLGREAGPEPRRRASEPGPALPRLHRRRTLSSPAVPLQQQPGKDGSLVPHTEPGQQRQERPRASAEGRALPLCKATLQLLGEISSHQKVLEWLQATFPDTGGASAEQQEEQQGDGQQEVCQGEGVTEPRLCQEEKKAEQELSDREDGKDQELSKGEDEMEQELSQVEASNSRAVVQGEDEKEEDVCQGEEEKKEELCQGEVSGDEELWQGEEEKKEELCEEDDGKKEEQSEGEEDISCNIRDKPFGPVNEGLPGTSPQQLPNCPSTVGTEAAAEAAGDLPSTSPTHAGATASEAAGAELARAAGKEEQRTALAAQTQEASTAAASPACGEQLRAAGQESQAAAPASPCCSSNPLASLLEAHGLSEQGAGTVGVSVLAGPESQEGTLSMEEEERKDNMEQELWLSQGQGDRDVSQVEDKTEQEVPQVEDRTELEGSPVEDGRAPRLSSPAERLPVPAPEQTPAFDQHSQVPGQALARSMEGRGLSEQGAVPQPGLSRFRRALRALRRLFRWPRRAAQPQHQRPTASTRPPLATSQPSS
ncbi:uncharacterized protein LOC127480230 [Manacus candei]|uniref:uncharacterized protein LOC127480230 n=1 Tax=Manacus candei TaxID=415023 RepID=UPI00222671BC|nr:uncharacterized protein LOC127480230 [Manacus candei]